MYGLLIYDRAGAERNRRFIEALTGYAKRRGEELALALTSDIPFGSDENGPFVRYPNGKKPDYAIVRTIFPLMNECLEADGLRVFNNARTSFAANDKRRTHAVFSRLGVPCAHTLFMNRESLLPESCRFPLILKSADGHGGSEVFYVENPKKLTNIAAGLEKKDFLLQEPVDPGRDVRVYLLGKTILYAVERTSKVDFRSNYSLGGSCALYTPDDRMKKIVGIVAKTLDPTFIGVDFTFKNGEPLLNEIEDVVGSRMLYELTDTPVHELYFDKILSSLYGSTDFDERNSHFDPFRSTL